MKRLIYISAFLGLAFAACQKVDNSAPADIDAPEFIYAHTESDDTKTTVSDNGESCSILWSSGDKIARFATDGYVSRYTLDEGVGEKDATFKSDGGTPGSIPSLSSYVAYSSLPTDGGVNDQITCSEEDGLFTISHDHSSLANQTYYPNAFDYRAFPMVAVSEDGSDFSFKNVCGGLLLKLKGSSTIDNITIQGLADETIAGAYTVSAQNDGTPTINLTGDGKTIKMDCKDFRLDGETAENFYISVPPTDFENGFSVTLTDTDGFSRTYNSKAGSNISRSQILEMPEITFPMKEFDLTAALANKSNASYDNSTQIASFESTDGYIEFSVKGIDLTRCKGIGLVTDDCNLTVKFAFFEDGKYSTSVAAPGSQQTKWWYCNSPGNQTSNYVKAYDFPSWLTEVITGETPAVVDRIRIGVNNTTAQDGKASIHLVRLILY